MLLLNTGNLEPVVSPMEKNLPIIGEYYSEITDVVTEVVGDLNDAEDFCLVVEYHLRHIYSDREFDFKETFTLLKSNPRINAFATYLREHGLDTTMDADLIGVREKIKITYEYLGGFAYPIIYDRIFIGLPNKDEISE